MNLPTWIAAAASLVATLIGRADPAPTPVRFAIVGLTHDHARGFIPAVRGRSDIALVGIVETNRELVARYAASYQLNTNLFHPSLEELIRTTNVQAVATFLAG